MSLWLALCLKSLYITCARGPNKDKQSQSSECLASGTCSRKHPPARGRKQAADAHYKLSNAYDALFQPADALHHLKKAAEVSGRPLDPTHHASLAEKNRLLTQLLIGAEDPVAPHPLSKVLPTWILELRRGAQDVAGYQKKALAKIRAPTGGASPKAWAKDILKRWKKHGVVLIEDDNHEGPSGLPLVEASDFLPHSILNNMRARVESFNAASGYFQDPSYVVDLNSATWVDADPSRSEWILALADAQPLLGVCLRALWPIILKTVGGNARVAEMAAITTFAGAPAQRVHQDTFPQTGSDDAAVMFVFVPLINIEVEMGPTQVWPGTHLIRDLSPMTKEGWEKYVLLTNTDWYVPVSARAGSMYLYDSRLIHRGSTFLNGTLPPRAIFMFSLISQKGRQPHGRTWAIHDSWNPERGGTPLIVDQLV